MAAVLMTACTSSPARQAVPSLAHPTTHVQESPALPEASAEPALVLVPAGATLLRECRSTARQVGYGVPCPRLLPQGWQGSGGGPAMVRWEPSGPLARWAALSVGFHVDTANLYSSSGWHQGHLVIESSPFPFTPKRMFFHGGGGGVFPAGSTRINGTPAHWYRVLGESEFSFHLVVVWTHAGHTYAVGFHDWTVESRTFGLEVARSVVPVGST